MTLRSIHRILPSALACALLAVAQPPTVAAQDVPPEADPVAAAVDYYREYRQAHELYVAGRHEEAAPLLARLVELNPGDAQLWYRLGWSHEDLGRDASAVDAYRAALERGYRYTPWVRHRGARLFARMGQADSALAWLETALRERYDDRPSIAADPAFQQLADDPRFQRIHGRVAAEDFSRDEGWRHDLDYLVQEARRMHAAPGRPAFSAAFDSAARALRARIPELSNDRMVIEMRALLALLGDGHTGIYGPGPDTPLTFEGTDLPVLFYQFEDGVHIVNAADGAERWIGARLLRIGDRPIEEILRDLSPYVHHDNPMTPRWLGIHFYLRSLAVLQALDAAEDPTRAVLTLRHRDGTEHRVVMEGGRHEFLRKLRPPAGDDMAPLYLRDVDRAYWLRPLPEADAVYWQFNQVRNMEEGPPIAAFSDSLRATLERTAAANLIIDVRHNNGGNNGLLAPLLRTLVWWEQDAPGRTIYVITGRNTFSAAQNFINRVERWTDAVFVGEPSASRPNFAGEETNLTLPYSQVRGSVSTLYWQDSDPDDERRWIAPQVPVGLTSEAYFGNRDPALEAILRIITEG